MAGFLLDLSFDAGLLNENETWIGVSKPSVEIDERMLHSDY
jgi:hypothetical protein